MYDFKHFFNKNLTRVIIFNVSVEYEAYHGSLLLEMGFLESVTKIFEDEKSGDEEIVVCLFFSFSLNIKYLFEYLLESYCYYY